MHYLLTFGYKFPKATLVFLFLISAFSATRLDQLRVNSSMKNLMSADDPDKLFYDQTVDLFGSDKITSIVVKDKDLFESEKLYKLEELYFALEEIPEIQKVDSLFNISNFHSKDGSLHTLPLLDPIPETKEEAESTIAVGLRNPLLVHQLLSSDAGSMSINVYTLEKDGDRKFNERVTEKIDNLINPLKDHFEDIYQIGPPSMATEVAKNITNDQFVSLPLVAVVIVIILFLTLRSFSGAIVPFLSGILTLICIGAYATYVDIPFQMLTMAIPVIIFVIGSTEDTHLVSEYLEGIALGHDRGGAIRYLARKVSLPIVLTTITTFVGFSTILLNDIIVLKEFGHLSTVGIFINFLITILLGPAYLALFGEKEYKLKSTHHDEDEASLFTKIADVIYKIISKVRIPLLATILLISGYSLSQFSKIKTENNSLSMLKESSPTKINVNKFNKSFGGIFSVFVRLSHENNGAFKENENLSRLLRVHQLAESHADIQTAQSFAGQIALINREMKGGKESDFSIPPSDALIAQYLLFLSHEDKRSYINSDYNEANIVFRHQISSSHDSLELVASLEKEIGEILKDSGISFKLTSEKIRVDRAAHTIIKSQTSSILIIAVCLFFVIWILFFDIKIAFISLFPNLIPITGLFGAMALLEIPLDIGTCTISAVAIGIAADDTIHFFVRFNQNMKIFYDRELAIHTTLKEEIRPILSTSFALALGLSVLALSSFIPIIKFGLLLSFVIFLALISDLIVTPLLLGLFNTKGFVTLMDILSFDVKETVYKESDLFLDIPAVVSKKIIMIGKVIEVPKDDFIGPKFLSKNLYLLLEGETSAKKIAQRSGDQMEEIELSHYYEGSVFGSLHTDDFNGPEISSRMDCLTPCKFLVITPHFVEEIKNFSPIIEKEIIKNINHVLNTSVLT